MVAEADGISPVGVGDRLISPSASRFRFSGVGGEAAAASRWNKSSRALPRPRGALLRRQRRARGGGAPRVELLYRSRPSAFHRPSGKVSSLASRLRDKKVALGCGDAWRVDKARATRGGIYRRRRAPVHGRRSSGCAPGRCSFNVCIFFCSYCQSLVAIGFLRPWVGGGASPAMAGDSNDWKN